MVKVPIFVPLVRFLEKLTKVVTAFFAAAGVTAPSSEVYVVQSYAEYKVTAPFVVELAVGTLNVTQPAVVPVVIEVFEPATMLRAVEVEEVSVEVPLTFICLII
jgi:hypothetical protein